MAKGEIVIIKTDKSGKLCVATLEAYEKMGDIHCKEDPTIAWEEFEEAQRMITGHLKALNRVFKTGASHGENNMERAWEAKEMATHDIPLGECFIKDHKPLRTTKD